MTPLNIVEEKAKLARKAFYNKLVFLVACVVLGLAMFKGAI